MILSEKIREPAKRIGGKMRSCPTKWFNDMADQVVEVETKLNACNMRAKGYSMCEVCGNWFDPEEGGGSSFDGVDFCSVHWAEILEDAAGFG